MSAADDAANQQATAGVRAVRGVTRGYVLALIVACVTFAMALIVALWGILSVLLERFPVSGVAVAMWVAPVVVIILLGVLAIFCWRAALILLRGRVLPAWGEIFSCASSVYLLWCLLGMLGGMPLEDTWLSPFAAALALVMVVAQLCFWLVLARRRYTLRETPRWPWERAEDDEE